jgi:hypothetical protein
MPSLVMNLIAAAAAVAPTALLPTPTALRRLEVLREVLAQPCKRAGIDRPHRYGCVPHRRPDTGSHMQLKVDGS